MSTHCVCNAYSIIASPSQTLYSQVMYTLPQNSPLLSPSHPPLSSMSLFVVLLFSFLRCTYPLSFLLLFYPFSLFHSLFPILFLSLLLSSVFLFLLHYLFLSICCLTFLLSTPHISSSSFTSFLFPLFFFHSLSLFCSHSVFSSAFFSFLTLLYHLPLSLLLLYILLSPSCLTSAVLRSASPSPRLRCLVALRLSTTCRVRD